MELRTERPDNKTLILHIDGRFDAYTVGDVKATWLNDDSVKFVIADLSATTFIDSMALAVLVSGLKVVRQRGGDFILAKPAQAVSIILELTSIDRAFNVVGSVEEGLRLAAA
jgi:anti-sigma B factor antagonist